MDKKNLRNNTINGLFNIGIYPILLLIDTKTMQVNKNFNTAIIYTSYWLYNSLKYSLTSNTFTIIYFPLCLLLLVLILLYRIGDLNALNKDYMISFPLLRAYTFYNKYDRKF